MSRCPSGLLLLGRQRRLDLDPRRPVSLGRSYLLPVRLLQVHLLQDRRTRGRLLQVHPSPVHRSQGRRIWAHPIRVAQHRRPNRTHLLRVRRELRRRPQDRPSQLRCPSHSHPLRRDRQELRLRP
jgi:hypothetical protein